MASAADDVYSYDEEFRDSIATVDEEGKRIWVYPKKPGGKYHQRRILVTIILLAIFFAGPFIRIGGQPMLLLNFFDRKFVILGQVFWPQDFFLLALTLITLFVFIILFTVAFGRVWCGWACPQTLFMEMVFRKIEYWIEGDAQAQRRLNQQSLNADKFLKKTAKHVIFIAISIIIAHTAMAYLIGIDETLAIVQTSPFEHLSGFIGIVAFTAVFYGVFAKFREQACIAVCPYGRLQGVLLTKESLVVAYDWLRGEPRGKLKKKNAAPVEKAGDCIDCKLCVHVCPTGIDIRNGTQLECVNCTACMDACDEVMLKINKPTGLIRFASYNSIKDGVKKVLNVRVMAYAAVLTLLVGFLSYMIFTRAPVQTTLLKVPGTLYQKQDDGTITNLYTMEFANKTFEDIQLSVKVESPKEAVLTQSGERALIIPAEDRMKAMFIIGMPKEALEGIKTKIKLGVYRDGKRIERLTATFIGPLSNNRAHTSD